MKAPLFLARASYRRRRLRDAARLLPLVGAFLIWLPMLWGKSDSTARDTGMDVIYLFVVWTVLVLAAAVLAPRLGGDEPERTVTEDEG
ncbi:hypothetical protein [Szabonella alba]|uniref:Uncharacterized protein n=1 Tax=Szabonella alba TaxID=2804194 RepID=A0A8K0VCL8_9RHOB|nr:hypothetical protein [Szabonella alba]